MRSLALVLLAASACSAPQPAAPPQQRTVGSQSQALVESSTGTFELRFVPDAGTESHAIFEQAHALTVTQGEGELRIQLTSSEMSFAGLADELDDQRWIAGLAGVEPNTEAPVVLRMTALHARDAVTGSAVIDVESHTHTASFIARRIGADGDSAAPNAEAAPATSTHYHLPVTSP